MAAAPMPSPRHRALLAAFAALVGGLATLNAIRFAAAGHDDTFILLWSGRTFGLHSWFSNFNLEPQEMSSSWIGAWSGTLAYWLAPTSTLLAYKALGALAGLACVACLWPARVRLFGERAPETLAIAAAALTLLSPTFGYWVHGGLETPYQSLFFIAWILAADRHFSRGTRLDAALLVATSIAVILARTEGFWILAALALLAWLTRGGQASTRRTVVVIAVVAAAFALTLALRRAFTGALWPDPVYAKLDSLPNDLRRGLSYVRDFGESGALAFAQLVGAIYGAVVIACARAKRPPIAVLACAVLSLGQTAFVIAAGGNWMEYFRFLTPTVLPNTILLLHMLEEFRARAGPRVMRAGLAVLGLAAFAQAVTDDGLNTGSGGVHFNCAMPLALGARQGAPLVTWLDAQLIERNVAHARDARALQPFIAGKLSDLVAEAGTLRIATSQMGYLPYFVRQRFGVDRVRFIDTTGLSDREIALTPARRDSMGLEDGFELDRVLTGEAGALSDVVRARSPNAAYMIDPDERVISKLRSAGFELVWDVPKAKVFYRR